MIGWNGSHTPPIGKWGACCAEMDIWEANSKATAYTPHPCSITGPYTCEGIECGDNSKVGRTVWGSLDCLCACLFLCLCMCECADILQEMYFRCTAANTLLMGQLRFPTGLAQEQRYDGVCDKDGCDFNSFRLGDGTYYGRGKKFAVNSRRLCHSHDMLHCCCRNNTTTPTGMLQHIYIYIYVVYTLVCTI